MTTASLKNFVIVGGVFVLPIVLVKATAIMIGSAGPQQATATLQSTTPSPAIEHHSKQRSLSEKETAAMQYIMSLGDKPFGTAPLYYEKQEAIKKLTNREEPDEGLMLQGIIVRPNGNLAIINGTIYRASDRIGTSHNRVANVDGVSQTVTIENHRFNPPQNIRLQMAQ